MTRKVECYVRGADLGWAGLLMTNNLKEDASFVLETFVFIDS